MASSGKHGRADRLAAQLRENLMRRKAQARSRRAGEADGRAGLPAAETQQPAVNGPDGAGSVAKAPESADDGA